MGLFGFGKKEKDKMKDGLEKTRTGFWGNILNTLTGSKIDDDLYDELEEQLILADVGGEVLVRRTEVERELGIAEVQVVVREVDRERHREPVDVEVEIGEEAIAQRRHISQPGRAVEVGVVGTYGAGDDERVALGYLRNVLRADGRNGPRAGHQNGC